LSTAPLHPQFYTVHTHLHSDLYVIIVPPAHLSREALDLLFALGLNVDHPLVTGSPLHDIADDLVIHRRSRGHGHEGAFRIEQGDRAVLQFPGGIALRVDVADLLELERTLEGGRVAVATPDEHEAARVDVAPCQLG